MAVMRGARAWLPPAGCCLLASALYLVVGEVVSVGIALWFSWCMTRACDADHLAVRYLGWFMLSTITSVTLVRFALGQ